MNKTEHQVDEVEVRDLALALRDLLEVIDGKIHIGDVPINECRPTQFARKMLEQARQSKNPNFRGV